MMSSHVHHDRCQAWQTKLGSCHPRHKNIEIYKPQRRKRRKEKRKGFVTTSTKLIEAIRDNDQESRKELFLWLFERAGKSNPNNTHYQFWQQHSHPIELN